mgnify:CR=1 FL=1
MNLNYDFFPAYLQEIIKKLTDVYQIDSDYVVSGLFSAAAAALGDRYQIIDPKGYRNSVALWLCHIGESGYGKSECASWLMEPLINRDEERHLYYKKELATWVAKEGKERGEQPIEQKLVINDYTPEALFDGMEKAGNNGILLYRDELQGWLKDIGRYGKSGEVEQYLSAWSQKCVRVSRLNRSDNLIKRPCFNVFGGIQPDMLPSMFGSPDLIANGFNSRFLFVFSDENLPLEYWRESVADTMRTAYRSLVERLLAVTPTEVKFSPAAEKEFINYWELLQRRKAAAKGMESQMMAKLQIYVEKLAGVIEILTNDGKITPEISQESMRSAITCSKAFGEWALKAYRYILPQKLDLKIPKNTVLKMLKTNYPNLNQKIVAEGLGIDRSQLSRA